MTSPLIKHADRRVAGAATLVSLLFLVIVVAQDQLKPGFHPQREFISALASGRYGWIQVVNFVALGAVMLSFALVLRRTLAASRPGLGVLLLTLISIGVLGSAFFRAEAWPPASMGLQGLLHLVCAVVLVFGSIPMCCLAFARVFARDARFQGLASYTRLTGAATLVLFAGGLALMSPPGSAPRIGNSYGGLIQRADAGIFLIWQAVAASRVRKTYAGWDGLGPRR